MTPAATKPKEIISTNPATNDELGRVRVTTSGELDAIVTEARRVQRRWGAMSHRERSAVLRRAAEYVRDHHAEIAELITKENGKTVTESYAMEVLPVVDTFFFIARNAGKILSPQRVPTPQLYFKQKRHMLFRQPMGVVGIISPWNYPFSIPAGEVAIALSAGNAVVLKPAPITPLIGEWIKRAFDAAGLPDGLLTVVHGDAPIGKAMCQHPGIGKIFFTGSVEVGRKVGVECAKRMKGSVLELGGKDPQIVCADADLANAVSGAVWGGFANAGQTCSGIERTYVVREVADRFIAGVVRETERLTVGDPLEWDTEIGPMVSAEQAEIVTELVDDAIANGAERLIGGPRVVPGFTGTFIAPTVLTGVTHEMRIMREEIFGPVLPIVTVDSEEQALDMANDSRFGLGASIWTKDRAKGERMARRVESGMVWINDHSYSHGACQCSWGGVKESGVGRTHSKFGFYECVDIKLVAWEPGLTRDFWWQPYDRTLGNAVRASAQLVYGRDGNRLRALREGALPLLRATARTFRKGR